MRPQNGAGSNKDAQRIVRANKAITKAGLTFEVPRGAERAARLPSVLETLTEQDH